MKNLQEKYKKDFNYHGCITTYDPVKDADRILKLDKQFNERGFDDSETYSLNTVIAKFALPRVKRYKELHTGTPVGMSDKKFCQILDKIIFALECEATFYDCCEGKCLKETRKIYNKAREGMVLFGKHFGELWW